MRLLPKSIHWCRRYPTKFNSGRDIPFEYPNAATEIWAPLSLIPDTGFLVADSSVG